MIVQRDRGDFFGIWFLDEFMAGHKGYIAGGCFKDIFTGKRVKDIDVFFERARDFSEAKLFFDTKDGYYLFYENENVTAFKHVKSGITIELCKKVFAPAEDMIGNFDFTIAKFAYYKAEILDEDINDADEITPFDAPRTKIEYRVAMDSMFFEHLQQKRLVVDDKLLYPMSTFERMIRYIRYGYMPCRETKLKIARAIHSLEGEPELNSKSLYSGID